MASFWDWVPAAITAGATWFGADQASDASDKAAQIGAQAQREGTAAQLESLKVAQSVMQNQQNAASPGLTAIQEVVGSGDRLTPLQQRQLQEAERTSLDTLQGGSLRGSARATAAVVDDVRGRMTDTFMDSNRTRADQAASNLSGQYFNAGNNMANLNLKTGDAISAGLVNTGDINAANTLGQAKIKGQAIGDIGAVIADQLKANDQKKRDSSYSGAYGSA